MTVGTLLKMMTRKKEKMDKEELEDEICEYVHSHYKVAALGFSYRDLRDVAEHFALPREEQITDLKGALEFYEKEQYEIANDNTIQEVMKDLENHQEEVTVDDYSPYDENTWGMMHEEMYVPKELAKEYLVESHMLSEHRKDLLDKAANIIKQLLLLPYANNEEVCDDVASTLGEAESFLKEII